MITKKSQRGDSDIMGIVLLFALFWNYGNAEYDLYDVIIKFLGG